MIERDRETDTERCPLSRSCVCALYAFIIQARAYRKSSSELRVELFDHSD